MRKLKVGIYYDLPKGGARRLMDGMVTRLAASFDLVRLPVLAPHENRLTRDFQNFVDSYAFARSLNHIIRQEKLDVLLVSHDHFFAAPAILSTAHIPTLVYCHEPTRALYEPELGVDPKLPWQNRLYEHAYRAIKRIMEKSNARHATQVICNSQYSATSIKHAYGVTAPVVYPGLDPVFTPLQSTTHNLRSILIVGNDEPQKRLSLAVRAVGLLPKSIRPPLNLICPRSAPGKSLIDLAHRHGVRLNIRIGITDQELAAAYQQATVTLVTALREPYGLSAAESLACGTPVVAANEGGVKEIVQDGISGYLTDDTPAALAKALTTIIKDPIKAHSMGLSGHDYVAKEFTWDKMISDIKNLLQKISI